MACGEGGVQTCDWMDGSFLPSSQIFPLLMVVEVQKFWEELEEEQTILASVMDMPPPASHLIENLNPGVTLHVVSSSDETNERSLIGQVIGLVDLQPGLHHVS
eukprot:412048-Hanusia_phi.AAC.4